MIYRQYESVQAEHCLPRTRLRYDMMKRLIRFDSKLPTKKSNHRRRIFERQLLWAHSWRRQAVYCPSLVYSTVQYSTVNYKLTEEEILSIRYIKFLLLVTTANQSDVNNVSLPHRSCRRRYKINACNLKISF